jgi:hypothetical protein
MLGTADLTAARRDPPHGVVDAPGQHELPGGATVVALRGDLAPAPAAWPSRLRPQELMLAQAAAA